MADRVLLAYLTAMREASEASVAALFVVHGDSLPLEAGLNVSERDLQNVKLAWSTARREMVRGGVLRIGSAAIWALTDDVGLIGLAYLQPAGLDVPLPEQRSLGKLMAVHLRRLAQSAASDEEALSEIDPDEQLRLALHRCAGNVSAIARLLGISRPTVYERAAKIGLNPRDFRIR
jgi:hypothetical protein